MPRTDGAGLIVPGWDALPSLVEQNRAHRRFAAKIDVQGVSLGDLRRQTQLAAKTLSRDYLAKTLRLPVPDWSDDAPLIVGGHQPELFHAGVWAKNFAVARLARQVGGVPLQLIVDQDTLNSHAIKVPVGTRATPALATIDFDAPHARSPWETATVQDPAIFESFARRVTEAIAPWGVQPLVADQWPIAVEQARRTGSLVDALTALRATTERRWGAGTFELPLSHWWSHPALLWFMAHLLAQHRRLLDLYNDVLKEYRVANRVRSRAHPVPDLVRQDDWYESPFWVWHNGDARRERLFVRQAAGQIELRDSLRTIGALPLDEHRSATDAVIELHRLSNEGWRFRSRALTTTWAARMLLADVFIHGLGGAKYDEMTDALIGRFWGVTPPDFATVSATVHLPLGEPWPEDHRSVGLKKHAWQDALHNPERHWDGGWPDAVLSLAAEKRRWLATADTVSSMLSKRQIRAENHRRDQRLRQIRQQLLQLAEPVVQRLHRDYDEAVAHQTANRILQRREFSWVLFPEDQLRAVFERLFP
ncbi:MAG TPA: hypothetical protein VFG20_10190 [Planctomycetaceae bacterium]|nr:hypothetical protein [Planctomycetaceae bacterium]